MSAKILLGLGSDFVNNILSLTKLLFFSYYLSWGALSPYISRYFSKVGLSGAEIGFLQGLTALLALFIPPIWGFIADAKKWEKQMLLLSLYGMALGLMLYYYSHNFLFLLIATLIYASANGPISPLLDSIALKAAEVSESSYGNIRLYGSVGYAVLASLMPYLYNSAGNPGIIFLVSLLFVALTILLVYRLPEDVVSTKVFLGNSFSSLRKGFFRLIKEPAFAGLMIIAFLARVAVVPYYNFFAMYLEGLQASTFIVGNTWFVAILGEVLVLYNSERWLRKIGTKKLLLISLALSATRWLIYANVTNPWIIFSLQWLHGFTFAALHAVIVKLVKKLAPSGMEVSAQSLYAAVNLGLGGFVGSIVMGYIYDYFGGAEAIVQSVGALFVLSAVLTIVAFFIANFSLNKLDK